MIATISARNVLRKPLSEILPLFGEIDTRKNLAKVMAEYVIDKEKQSVAIAQILPFPVAEQEQTREFCAAA